MPEGPKCHTSTDHLSNLLLPDAKIKLTVINSMNATEPPRWFGGRYSDKEPAGFAALWQDCKSLNVGLELFVKAVECKGKHMWWELELIGTNVTWFFHYTFGMSGRWSRLRQEETQYRQHIVCQFDYESPTSSGRLTLYDPRHFGSIKFTRDRNLHDKILSKIGPDLLGSQPPNVVEFAERILSKPSATLAEALMNQGNVSGIGNYVKSEALWRARLSPHRQVTQLIPAEFEFLYQSCVDVLNESYEAQGATLRDYRTTDSSPGAAQFRFNVYGRPRDIEGNETKKEETLDGRTTWWVPSRQF